MDRIKLKRADLQPLILSGVRFGVLDLGQEISNPTRTAVDAFFDSLSDASEAIEPVWRAEMPNMKRNLEPDQC